MPLAANHQHQNCCYQYCQILINTLSLNMFPAFYEIIAFNFPISSRILKYHKLCLPLFIYLFIYFYLLEFFLILTPLCIYVVGIKG